MTIIKTNLRRYNIKISLNGYRSLNIRLGVLLIDVFVNFKLISASLKDKRNYSNVTKQPNFERATTIFLVLI